MKLTGKVALVTGASRGIGALVAKALAEQGAEVWVHARTQESAQKTVDAIVALGGKAHAVAAELRDPAQVEGLAQTLLDQGGCDILYNNAAVMAPWRDPWTTQVLADWEWSFQVNVYAPMTLAIRLLPHMKESGWGRIVNVTSGIERTPQLAAYGATKAALDKWTSDMAAGLEGTGILVSRLDPGWLRTDLGGPNADHAPETVLPGALVPVLLTEGDLSGQLFRAQEYR